MAEAIIMGNCGNCGAVTGGCPKCINTIGIDPETMMPPDVEISGGVAVRIEPSPEAIERTVRMPLCDNCVIAAQQYKPELETEKSRHARTGRFHDNEEGFRPEF